MKPHALGADDANSGEALLRLLDEQSIKPDAALWLWSDEHGTWQFVLAGGRLDAEPDKAPTMVADALAGLGAPFAFDRVVLLTVDAPLLVAMGAKVQVSGVSRVQLGANMIDDTPVPPSLVYRLKVGTPPSGRRSRTVTVNGVPVDGTDEDGGGEDGGGGIDGAAVDAVQAEARRRYRAAKAEARTAKVAAARARRDAARARRPGAPRRKS